MGGKLVFPGGGAYHGSKYAVEALSDALRFEVRDFGVRVSIIEPRLITTQFGETAAGSLAQGSDPPAGGQTHMRASTPRSARRRSASTKGRWRGSVAGPRPSPGAIERAISSRNPKPHYKVTASARLALGQRALLTDRAWDAVMRSQFPSPKAE